MFNIYPAIDLINGEVVNLKKGLFDQTTTYSMNALDLAKQYKRDGATWLHVVDLDGACNPLNRQNESIASLTNSSGLKIQVGGGVRTKTDIVDLLEKGVKRVIIGSLAATGPAIVDEFITCMGATKFTLALDVDSTDIENPRVMINAWKDDSNKSLWDLLDIYSKYSDLTYIVTAVENDGMMIGPKFELYELILKKYPNLKIIASGGVRNKTDVNKLEKMGLEGAIIGKSLLDGHVKLKELL